MKDRRTVDALSVEELEEILWVRKREERLERVRQWSGGADGLGAMDPVKRRDSVAPSPPPAYRRFGITESGLGSPERAGDDPIHQGDVRDSGRWRVLRRRWGWLGEKLLLGAEIGVLAALTVVLVSSLTTWRKMHRDTSQAQAVPSSTVTPAIQPVLPGDPAPPDAADSATAAEIPAHLRGWVSAVTPLPVPTAGPEQPLRIEIPVIGVDAPVVQGDDWESLKRGAGHHIGSANPGERGNCVISAHNDVFGQIFRDLPDLSMGEEVLVHTASRVFRYVITQRRIVEPTEVSVMRDTASPVLTLISCYPYGVNTHRVVVIGELEP